MAALQEVSENWDDDFEFQVERRKMSTTSAKSEATENWDDDFEDSRQSPKKIIQRETWDDEDDEENGGNYEFGSFAEEDRTVTAKSRRAALARLSTPGHHYPPRSPTSSVFSVPTTVHTYSSTTHLRATSAFALIPPSPPIHKERERRRLRKKSRPKPQGMFELAEMPYRPSQERPSFLDEVDLPRPSSELRSGRTESDLSSIDERPPPVAAISNDPVSIPPTPTKGAALLIRIGSVKKWGVRRRRGESTAPVDTLEPPIKREPIANINKWDPRRRKRGDSTTPIDTIPNGSCTEQANQSIHNLPTPKKGRRRSATHAPDVSTNRRDEFDCPSTTRASSSLSSYQKQQQHPLPPLPSAVPLPPDTEPEPSIPQLPVQQQRTTSSSSWFFRNASKNNSNTTTTNSELGSPSSPSTGVVRPRRSGSRSRIGSEHRDGNPDGNRNPNGNNASFYSTRTPNASRTDLSGHEEIPVSRKMSEGEKKLFATTATGSDSAKLPTLTPTTTPTKLVKRKSFGFVHLGRGLGGHVSGDIDVMGSGERQVDGDEDEGHEDGEDRQIKQDRIRYAGLGLGRASGRGGTGDGVDGDGGDEYAVKAEKRSRRRSLSHLLMDRDKDKDKGGGRGKDKEKEGEGRPEGNEKEKEGTRSFMGSVRRISLVSAGVVGRHKKTKSGGFVSGRVGSPAPIPPMPTALPSVLTCASQVSLRVPSATSTTTNSGSDQHHKSTRISTADLRRAGSLSSPIAGGGPSEPTPSTPATPVRSHSSSRPSSVSSTKKRRRTLSKPRPQPRKSEELSQDQVPKASLDLKQGRELFSPSEGTDIIVSKTPTQSTSSSTATSAFVPLLPPIELQPPSPPRTMTTRHIQRRSRAYTTNEFVEGLESQNLVFTPSTSSSLAFFTPTSSPSQNNVARGGGLGGIPLLSPSKHSPGKSPSPSQQSVSLGRSTAANVGSGDETALGGSSSAGGLPRRNSLGDLKIPARISQAQVGLKRDLGMVREFASNVEQLKELQSTYNVLVIEVQALLDTHLQRVQPSPPPAEKSPPVVPHTNNFFIQLKSRPKTRVRSNTTGSTTPHAPDVADSGPSDVVATSSQAAYKGLVEAFWTINSKYRIPWECAELLIELGSGNGGDDGGAGVVSAATASVSAPVIQPHLSSAGGEGEGEMLSLKGKERAITLMGDESKHSTTPPPAHAQVQTQIQSQPSSAIVPITGSSSMPGGMHPGSVTGSGGPPLASPPSMSWRASTGRHDLSQRQLVLLREMLDNNGGPSLVSASGDDEESLRSPLSQSSVPGGENSEPALSPYHLSSRLQYVNRDWSWGDARNSTITLSEEREGGAEGGRRDRKTEKEKKRMSGRLGMSSIRDMLRSLKKGQGEEPQTGNYEVQSGQPYHHHHHGRLPAAVALAQPMMCSTTSLSTESSIGNKGFHNQAPQQNHLPVPRIPSQIRRRGRSSTGPESMSLNKGPSPPPFSPLSFTASKSSPRRPSLASIFRIGSSNNNKARPVINGVVHIGVDDPSTSSSALDTSEHDLSAVQCNSATTGTEGEDHNSIGEEEEEDWDRMDSASDLDAAAAKALGIVDGAYDVSATVRGRNKIKTKAGERKKAGVSPYLQRQASYESDQQPEPLPSLPASSSSTGLGGFLARHSIIPKRSFSASQSSIWGSGGGDGQPQPHPPSRLSRHSNFQGQPAQTAIVEPPASLRISSSKSAPTTSQAKQTNVNSSSSRPANFPKAGSVRSIPPHLAVSSLHPQGPLSSLPDPKLGMIMTPENIKPLLENAKEVHVKLHECIAEIRALIENGAAVVGHSDGQAAPTS